MVNDILTYKHICFYRMDDITRSIKRSFAIARLLKKLNEMKEERRPWTQRKRGLWKHIKTTS